MHFKSENDLYEPIRKWLTKHMGYYTGGDVFYMGGSKSGTKRYYTKTGIRELQADVVGVKFSGNRVHSEIEICVVEVKLADSITRQHINQAYGYTSMAHSVILASPAQVDKDSQHILRALGLGYLQVMARRMKLVESPTPRVPPDREFLHLLENLWIGRCALCQCYFPLWRKWSQAGKTYQVLERPYFPTENPNSDFTTYDKQDVPKNQFLKRYLCWYCMKDIKHWTGAA